MPKTYVGDDAMKCALRVAKPVLSLRELAEVLRRAWYHVIEQSEHDSASRFRVDRHVELHQTKKTRFNQTFWMRCKSSIMGVHKVRSPCF